MPSATSNRISTQNGSQNEGIYYLTGQEWKLGQVLDQLDEQLNNLMKSWARSTPKRLSFMFHEASHDSTPKTGDGPRHPRNSEMVDVGTVVRHS